MCCTITTSSWSKVACVADLVQAGGVLSDVDVAYADEYGPGACLCGVDVAGAFDRGEVDAVFDPVFDEFTVFGPRRSVADLAESLAAVTAELGASLDRFPMLEAAIDALVREVRRSAP